MYAGAVDDEEDRKRFDHHAGESLKMKISHLVEM